MLVDHEQMTMPMGIDCQINQGLNNDLAQRHVFFLFCLIFSLPTKV